MGVSFAGMYESVELANSGPLAENYEEFKKAFLTILSSVFRDEVLQYREENGLLDQDEQMSVLTQFANGDRVGDYFYPPISAVAQSYATVSIGGSPRRGAVKIGLGFGRTLVDTRDGIVVCFSKPNKTFGEKGMGGNSLAVLNLKTGRMERKTVRELFVEKGLSSFANAEVDEGRYDPNSFGKINFRTTTGGRKRSQLLARKEYIVQKLAYQLGYHVEVEFTTQENPEREGELCIKVVQCRPLKIAETAKPSRMPKGVKKSHVLMASNSAYSGSRQTDIEYLLHIDPSLYDNLDMAEVREVRLLVGQINEMFKAKSSQGTANSKYMIASPRKWGGADTNEGVPVGFSDFSAASAVVELHPSGGALEEQFTFGMHFGLRMSDVGMCIGGITNREMKLDAVRKTENCAEFEELRRGMMASVSGEDELGKKRRVMLEKMFSHVKLVRAADLYKAAVPEEERSDGDADKMAMHFCQDNTPEGEYEARPLSLYFAPKGQALPEEVEV
jgi:hypothetical protein